MLPVFAEAICGNALSLVMSEKLFPEYDKPQLFLDELR